MPGLCVYTPLRAMAAAADGVGMKPPWPIAAFHMTTLVVAFVLIGFAIGWVHTVVLGGAFGLVMAGGAFAAFRSRRDGSAS